MSTSQRIALFAAALVVAVAAFVLLQPNDEDEPTRSTSQPTTETAGEQPTDSAAEEPAPPPKPKPEVTLIRIRGGEPVGGEAEVTVKNGETIRLSISSDVADEVHVHGYDLSKEIAPGKPVRFRFKADIEGLFEVELEQRGVPIAQLEVRP